MYIERNRNAETENTIYYYFQRFRDSSKEPAKHFLEPTMSM